METPGGFLAPEIDFRGGSKAVSFFPRHGKKKKKPNEDESWEQRPGSQPQASTETPDGEKGEGKRTRGRGEIGDELTAAEILIIRLTGREC